MTLSPPSTPEDPTSDAARLLVRLGVGLLVVGVPCCAVVSRGLIYSLMPIGGVLVLIGTALAPSRQSLTRLRGAVLSSTGLSAIFLAGWAGLSLAWAPFVVNASAVFFQTLVTILLAVCVAAFLPERSQTSNLYLLPIGTAAAAISSLIATLAGPLGLHGVDLSASLARSAVSLIVLVWPALAALALRERWALAAALAIAVAIAAIAIWTPVALAAFALAAVTFCVCATNPARVSRILAGVFAALFLVAPALPLAFGAVVPAQARSAAWLAPILVWADIVRAEGLRLVTGHGFGTSTQGLVAGFLPSETPTSVLFQVWYDLGIVGACAAAALVARAFLMAGRTPGTIAPFLVAGLVCALTIAISGQSTTQLWWLTELSVVAIAFAVVTRGRYRTFRPALDVVNDAPQQQAV